MSDEDQFDEELPMDLPLWQRAGRFPVPHDLSLRADTDLWAIQTYCWMIVRRLGFKLEFRSSFEDCLLKYRYLWGPKLANKSCWYMIYEIDLDVSNISGVEAYLFDHLTDSVRNHTQIARVYR